jgi:shikimate kinase/3-dehydroquinate synthase
MSALSYVSLVGLPGSGKSTVATVLARRLGWDCVDIDTNVAAKTGKPAAAIIEQDGEAAFRELELAALEDALRGRRPAVIACGAGLITQDEARRLLVDSSCVVWLDAPDAVLLQRVGDAGGRPLLHGDPSQRIPALRAERRRAYQAAHLRVPADGSIATVSDRIMHALEDTIRVDVAGRAYHVEIRPGALEDVALHVPDDASRVAVIADRAAVEATKRLTESLAQAGREVNLMEVSGGEGLKTWASAGRLLTRLTGAGIRRHDCVIALGGGTVGDLAGFVAATHLRGVAWINVPTTLLAMVDSAIGGKTGVNLARGKNLAGVIWQPRAVISDPLLLGSQPERSYRSAFAEIVKYSMIREDGLGSLLDHHLDRLLFREADVVAEAVRACCEIKADVVATDERDLGVRAILNYGHTIGHALEAATGFGDTVDHGEAVAVGMRVAGQLSVNELGCPDDDIAWQDTMLHRCGLGTAPPVDADRVVRNIAFDKKTVGESVGWVLLEARGRPRCGQIVPEHMVREAMAEVVKS